MLVKELIIELSKHDLNAEVVTQEAGKYVNTWQPIIMPVQREMRKSKREPFKYYTDTRADEEGLTTVVEI